MEKSIKWINTVLSRINMLKPEVGEHIVEKCGRECSQCGILVHKAKQINSLSQNKNNLEYLFTTYKSEVYKDGILYNENGVIYLEFNECVCELVKAGVNNPFMCNCTIGYTKEIFETLFAKPVTVKLHKSILKGDEICQQSIHIGEIDYVPFSL